jgi:hypothetical protein
MARRCRATAARSSKIKSSSEVARDAPPTLRLNDEAAASLRKEAAALR